jgi:CxxC motif-containing protein (DUF1111 family)
VTRFVAALAIVACTVPAEPEPPLAGGETTVRDRSSNAFSFPAANLARGELELHVEGDAEFEATFVTAPARVNPGLGPLFNNASCERCHVRDGRGLPATSPGGSALVVRVSVPAGEPLAPGGAIPARGLGTQLQDHAVHGVAPEVAIEIRWIEQRGAYGDGEPFVLRRPALAIALADGSPLPGEIATSARIPPPVFGLGLLEAVPEDAILALADPYDSDGDGISGRANYVWDAAADRLALGRFGWKASGPTLRQQAALAYAEDMGVSAPFPTAGASAEIDEHRMTAVTLYTQTLAVPARDRASDPNVRRGEEIFAAIGCAGCHVAELRTDAHPIAALVDQTIHPYTDLLLHNMGFELADAREDFLASGTEWRTAPLWGLGVSETVLPRACYLHDGRARTLEEAILWHGGEAEAAKESFRTLSSSERAALVAFLRSL